MASYNRRIVVNSEAIGRENIGEVKSTLLTRKHAGPKQAFGELKNVNSNQNISTSFKSNIHPIKTPLKSNIQPIKTPLKSNIQPIKTPLKSDIQPTKTPLELTKQLSKLTIQSTNENKLKTENILPSKKIEKKMQKPKILKDQSHIFVENPISDDPLFFWSQQIVLKEHEINRIGNGNDDKIQTPIPHMPVRPGIEIWNDREKKKENALFLSDLDLDQIVPIDTSELPNYSFEDEFFDHLLEF